MDAEQWLGERRRRQPLGRSAGLFEGAYAEGDASSVGGSAIMTSAEQLVNMGLGCGQAGVEFGWVRMVLQPARMVNMI